MFCRFCGKKVEPDSMFCNHCGNKLSETNSNEVSNVSFSEKNINDERVGMSIYFNDICRIEFIKKRLADKVKELEERIKEEKAIKYVWWSYDWDHRNEFHGNEIRFLYGYDGVDFYFYVESKHRGSDDGIFWYEYYMDIDFRESHKLIQNCLNSSELFHK